MPVGAAIGGAAVIGAGASIYSSNKASKAQQQAGQQASDASVEASKQASEAQLQATRESNALQQRMYDQNRADLTPWRETGRNALRELADLTGVAYNDGKTYDAHGNPVQTAAPAPQRLLGPVFRGYRGMAGAVDGAFAKLHPAVQPMPTMAGGILPGAPMPTQPKRNALQALMDSPGYQFRLAEGSKALDRSAAARGGLFSGATLKALSRYNQDYASNEYGNQWNRLASIAGIGQSATNQTGAYGQNAANAMSSGIMAGGNAMASNYLNAGNARASNYMNAGNARASNYLNMGNTINSTLNDAAAGYGYYNRPRA